MAILPDRLAALEEVRRQAEELETVDGDGTPDEWLTPLDELIETLDNITNWQGGPEADMLFVLTVDLQETQVEELGTVATDVGLGNECADIHAWKFFPDIPA